MLNFSLFLCQKLKIVTIHFQPTIHFSHLYMIWPQVVSTFFIVLLPTYLSIFRALWLEKRAIFFFPFDRKITILITSLANLKTRIIYDVPRVCTAKKSIFVLSKSPGPIVLYFYGKDLFEFRITGATETENSSENILCLW